MRGKMIVGYARTSTVEQEAGFEAQIVELKKAGCEEIFREQVSSVDVVAREQLAAALKFVRKGDTLIVTKLDRLARNVAHLFEIVAELNKKSAALRILDLNIDTGTATGELMLTIIGGIAQFERKIMLERQREGIAKAKGEGKYKGRKPKLFAKADEVRALRQSGVGATEIAKRLGIGRKTVYRLLETAA
jgi:DNA invertase Pin-like site-specific DNA recombinase